MSGAPLSESLRGAIAGLANAGKSSLMNALFGREVALVSPLEGTTTDPVTRSIELAGLGPCALTDTGGLDDGTELGAERARKSRERIADSDFLVLVSRLDLPPEPAELELAASYAASGRPLVIAASFADSGRPDAEKEGWMAAYPHEPVGSPSGLGMDAFKELLIKTAAAAETEASPLEGIVREGDHLLLVTPIDLATPKGRLILPQTETIRDALDRDCSLTIAKERELSLAWEALAKPPALVITDSQAFSKVAADIPPGQPLTSFSILFARKKGDLSLYVRGARALDRLRGGGRALIVEACSHHRQSDDIGTVKIPRLLRQLLSADLEIDFAKGIDEGRDYSGYRLAIFCGGCMRRRREMVRAASHLEARGLAVTNYGLFLAWANGLLPRALEPFPEAWEQYNAG